MTSLQSKSAGALLAALGTRGHSGITCAAHDGDATRLDISIASGAWAVLADGTCLADELASTHISGLSIAGNYRLWLDYVEVAAAYEPVWTVTSITPTPPTPSALDICSVDVGAGGISAIGPTEGGLRSLPQQSGTATLPAGVPVLRGPYTVDFGDIPHDGDTKVLWTPQVGDVLLRLFPDMANVVQWDKSATLSIYQENQAGIALATPGNIGLSFAYPNFGTLDSIADALSGQSYDPVNGNPTSVGSTVFHTTDSVVIKMWNPTADPTQGHVELYAVVARAVTP